MNIRESFKTQEEAVARLVSLMGTNDKVKKIDMRSYMGGFKIIFREQELDSEEE